MIFITGDTHGDFKKIKRLCKVVSTRQSDVIIILGDVGLNYFLDLRDKRNKLEVSNLPIKLFCIHGNHECRASNIKTYKETEFFGNKVLYEEEYPNILFAEDGEIYQIPDDKNNMLSTLVIGGAYSVDKQYRLITGNKWFSDEQPSDEIKARTERNLDKVNWNVDVVLSHTVPLKYEPVEMFLSGIDQSSIDKSTEIWLDSIEDRLKYRMWYAGHYHTDKKVDRVRLMMHEIGLFGCQ